MSLRSAADGDRCERGNAPLVDGMPMTGLLAEHLASVRMDVWSSMEQLMILIKQRAEVFQEEASRQLEADLAELRMENRSLRDQMARSHIDAIESRTGGTGDTMPPHAHQHRPASASSSIVSMERPDLPDLHRLFENSADDCFAPADMPPLLQESPPPFNATPAPPTVDPPGLAGELDETENDDTGSTVGLFRADSQLSAGYKIGSYAHASMGSTASMVVGTSHSQRIWGGFRSTGQKGEASSRPASAASSRPASASSRAPSPSPQIQSQTRTTKSNWSTAATRREPSRSKVFGANGGRSTVNAKQSIKVPEDKKKIGDTKMPEKKDGVFADATAMKERVRAAVAKPEYNVADFYWEEGWCQAIARHQFFEYGTLGVAS